MLQKTLALFLESELLLQHETGNLMTPEEFTFGEVLSLHQLSTFRLA